MHKLIFKSNARYFAGVAFFILAVFTLISCEKEVKIDLKDNPPKLVVEGGIENGRPPLVILTKSVGYFSTIDLNTLENSFVHGADVTVSDGSRTIKLREYSLDTGGIGNNISIYSIDTSDPSSFSFVGEFNKTYTLTIQYDGKIYESSTKIPAISPLDSLYIDNTKTPPDDIPLARYIYAYYNDPDTPGNFVRYYTSRNGSEYLPPVTQSAYSDELINGIDKFKVELEAGQMRGRITSFDSVGLFYVGDTVSVRWCAIDKTTYDFWSAYDYAQNIVGSPFATPVNVKSNISNGALGIWAGYGCSYHTIVIDK